VPSCIDPVSSINDMLYSNNSDVEMPTASSPPANVFTQHDHHECRVGGMQGVRDYCRDKGLRLTPVRARVLEILLEEHKALGAYDILGRLQSEQLGSQPPVVYRALDFLGTHGFVHRLERLNAFTACADPQRGHDPVFLICTDCLTVAETLIDEPDAGLNHTVGALGFKVTSRMIEFFGLCPDCQNVNAP